MESGSLSIFLVCAFAAEVIGTMAGFGAATVLTPIASFFLPIKTAVAVVACFHLFGNASRLVFFRRDVRWTVVVVFGSAGVLSAWFGAQASVWLPAAAVRMMLGIFLMAYVILEARQVSAVRVPATTRTLLVGGAVSGAIAGVIGTGGAIRSVCLLAYGLSKEAYLGTSAVLALLIDATRLPVYLLEGFIPASLGGLVVSLTVVAFCGAWCGQRLVRRVPARRFQQFVLVLLGVMGAKLLLDGLRGIG